MIIVTCYVKTCGTPHFLIPPPNTRTSLVYAEEIKQGVNSQAGTTIKTSGLLENNKMTSQVQQLAKRQKQINAKNGFSITTTKEIKAKDYIVVYCESGHKNQIYY
ncbi:MAG: hypothetical protein WBG71_12340 [Leeuwenhoekiella sp.]